MAFRTAKSSLRQRAARRRSMVFETLDARALLAVITVGPTGNFTTIQAAVNNASSGDTIQLAATATEADIFKESVNLSLMGSAIAQGTGNLTIVGDSLTAGTTIAPQGGSAFFNSAAFTGNLTFDRLVLRPNVATAGEDFGFNLDNITGDIAIRNISINDAVDGGLDLSNVQGSSGTISNLTMEAVEVRRNLDVITPLGLRLTNVQVHGLIHDLVITEVSDVGVQITSSGTNISNLTISESRIEASQDVLGNDGIRISTSGSAQLNVMVSESFFVDLPANSVDVLATGSSQAGVVLYRTEAINSTDMLRTANEPAMRFVSQNTARLSLGMDDSKFNSVNGDALSLQALNTSTLNLNLRDNFFAMIGNANGHDAVTVFGDASSNATLNLNIRGNDFSQVFGSSINVIGDGTSTYNMGINGNFFSQIAPFNPLTSEVQIRGKAGNASKLNLAMTENEVILDGSTTGRSGLRLDQAQAAVQLKVESTGVADTYLTNNNFGLTVNLTRFQTNLDIQVAPGTFTPRMPLTLGDYIWADTDKDGIQDAIESGASGALLTLTGTETTSGTAINQSVTSDQQGSYYFAPLLPGTYTVVLTPPAGKELTYRDRTTASPDDIDDELDSDFAYGTRVATVTLAAGVDNFDLDAGLVAAGGSLWQNPIFAVDVDGDNLVAPLDALLIINELNTVGPRLLPVPNATFGPTPFLDVSGDGFLGPLDALLIINRLNSIGPGGPTGEGESSAAAEGEPASSTAAANSGNSPYFSPDYFYGPNGTNGSSSKPDDDEGSALDALFDGLGN